MTNLLPDQTIIKTGFPKFYFAYLRCVKAKTLVFNNLKNNNSRVERLLNLDVTGGHYTIFS